MTSLNLTFDHNLSISLPPLSDAITKLDFLFPTASIDSLINNSTFTRTIGCSNSTPNVSCIDTCGNVSDVFSSWPNFYSCSWYPALAEALNGADLNVAQVEVLNAKCVSPNLSIVPSNISSTIATCLSDYCQSSPDCLGIDTYSSCSLDNLLSRDASGDLNRTSAIVCLRDSVCGSTASVNPDIGGLGVILSLMIQYSLSIDAFMLHFLFDQQYRLKKWRWRRKGNPESASKSLAEAKKTRKEHLEALTSAVVEFQKSQCFFAATLQIASLIVLPTFGPGEHNRDRVLLRLTAANAIAPIVLTLAHIEVLGGRNSTYILLLSALTYVLGTAAFGVSLPVYGGGFLFLNYDNPTIPVLSCGNLAPFAPCYLGNEFFLYGFWTNNSGIFYSETQNTGLTVWILTSGIMLYRLRFAFITGALDLKQPVKTLRSNCLHLYRKISNFMKSFRYIERAVLFCKSTTIYHISTKACHDLLIFLGKSTSWLYIQILFGTIALSMQFVSVIQVFDLSSNIIATQMSSGQIVAVGIWVPVLLEYGYLEINGAKEGTEYRLKQPLVVTAGPVPVAVGALQGSASVSGLSTGSSAGASAAGRQNLIPRFSFEAGRQV
ncbi:uncharacterized protein PAC_09962 [Phialocephala subalpina]|uniref:Uncharacterized protein n=1 Tax=Phialocephala subalpina TaxID=576137 RepID=A0A1L7X4Z1_9HELO|nr:uncharacterized protein PAC_09962 [Phialocephala subalpina]